MIRLSLLLAILPGVAQAHGAAGGRFGPEPWFLWPLVLSGAVFLLGFIKLRGRSSGGRRELGRGGALFVLGWATLAGAGLSPLHALGARSFTAHMLEHELIMLAAAPILVAARPLGILLWAFPPTTRLALAAIPKMRAGAAIWRVLSDPWLATVLQAAVLWLWHLPALFDKAMGSAGWHAAQHASFLAGALLFWSAMLGRRRNPWAAAICLFVTSMLSGALGAFMALSASPWYAPYAAMGLSAFGLTPTQDQQAAGVLMWVPGGLFHAAAALIILAPSLRSGPGTTRRSDRPPMAAGRR